MKQKDTPQIIRRNQDIYDMYVKLWSEGLRDELIYPQISKAFYLEERTVYRIVLDKRKEPATPSAPAADLFTIPENESK